MSTLEKQFEEELIKNYERSKKECGCQPTRLLQTVEKFGGVKTVKEILRKGRLSDGFDQIQAAGHLELTMEALVCQTKYGELFTDDEVNSCYELLCDYGYYKF